MTVMHRVSRVETGPSGSETTLPWLLDRWARERSDDFVEFGEVVVLQLRHAGLVLQGTRRADDGYVADAGRGPWPITAEVALRLLVDEFGGSVGLGRSAG